MPDNEDFGTAFDGAGDPELNAEAARCEREKKRQSKAPSIDEELHKYTSVLAWINRDIPEPVFLIGEVMSTTSRGLLVADTGVGKTNFCLAMAAQMADGYSFLHWRGSGKPMRVLIIEGEMSRRLVKSRLKDMVCRCGRVSPTLHIISRSDQQFAAMPPLNTSKGQRYIDTLIASLGGVDFIFFDNIQALTSGEMKEEDSWQSMLPWVRNLTNHEIGQLWIHHTGHDTSRAYGTKTREWQLDFVILFEKVERPDLDIAFSLKFTKARERAPHNRADFETMTVTLSGDQWKAEPAARRPAGKQPSPLARKFFDALSDALSVVGQLRKQSANRPSVTEEEWKGEARRLGLLDKDKPDSERSLWSQYRRELLGCSWIAYNGGFVWTTK